MEALKFDFVPDKLVGGSLRKNEMYGRKHYVAGFVQGNRIVHESRKHHKTKTDAIEYSKKVLFRYLALAVLALAQFEANQPVETKQVQS
jgi:hypothetical protein